MWQDDSIHGKRALSLEICRLRGGSVTTCGGLRRNRGVFSLDLGYGFWRW